MAYIRQPATGILCAADFVIGAIRSLRATVMSVIEHYRFSWEISSRRCTFGVPNTGLMKGRCWWANWSACRGAFLFPATVAIRERRRPQKALPPRGGGLGWGACARRLPRNRTGWSGRARQFQRKIDQAQSTTWSEQGSEGSCAGFMPDSRLNASQVVERTRLTCMAADPFDNQNEPRLEPTVGTPQREYENQNEPRMEHGLNTDEKDRQSRRASKLAKQRMPKQSVRNGPTVPPTGLIRV